MWWATCPIINKAVHGHDLTWFTHETQVLIDLLCRLEHWSWESSRMACQGILDVSQKQGTLAWTVGIVTECKKVAEPHFILQVPEVSPGLEVTLGLYCSFPLAIASKDFSFMCGYTQGAALGDFDSITSKAWPRALAWWAGKPATSLHRFQPMYFIPSRESIPDSVSKNPGSRSNLLIWQMIKRQQRWSQVLFWFFHPESESDISLGNHLALSATAEEADGFFSV